METNNKLREALEKIRDLTEPCEGVTECEVECNIAAKAALAEPARNCDVGTAEEQAERLHRFCINQDCATCPCDLGKADGRCEFAWMQMPYEEGGAK